MSFRSNRRALVGILALMLAATLMPAAPVSATVAIYTVTLSTSTPVVTYGGDGAFSATVTSGGVPAPSVDVQLAQALPDGTTSFIDWSTTDAAGAVTFEAWSVKTSASYVAVAGWDEGTSTPVTVSVAYAVQPPSGQASFFDPTLVSPVAIPPGGQIGVQGAVVPAGSTTPLVLQQRYGSGPWESLGTVPVNADGTFAMPLGKRAKTGIWTIRLTRPAENGLVAGVAEGTTTVTVTGVGRPRAWQPIAGTRSSPARWRTCRIGYRVNRRNMPADGLSDLREAMRRVTQVSGIRFRYLGRTSDVPYAGYTRAGNNRFTVAWASNKATRGLFGGFAAGVGGTSHSSDGRILTGYLAMNTAYTKSAEPGFGSGTPHGLVLMHELGHVVGLDHSPDQKQVMASGAPLLASVWGAADITGLRKVGSRCR